MTDMTIRDLSPEIVELLKQQASAAGQSLQKYMSALVTKQARSTAAGEALERIDSLPRVHPPRRTPALPLSLAELHGPAEPFKVPVHLYWGKNPILDPSDSYDVHRLYPQILTEGLGPDLAQYINPDVLLVSWGSLVLPRRVRDAWEERFPVLRMAPLQEATQ